MKRFATLLCLLAITITIASTAFGRANDGKNPTTLSPCASACVNTYTSAQDWCERFVEFYGEVGYTYDQCMTDALVQYVGCIFGCSGSSPVGGIAP